MNDILGPLSRNTGQCKFPDNGKTLREITKHIPNTHGVYIICDSKGEIVYIGKAGEIKQDGTFTKQGLHDRLNNENDGKRREDDFISKMQENKLDSIIINWYELDSKIEAPTLVEARLLQKYLKENRCLPIWNKKL